MRFIEINEVAEWCRENHIPVSESWHLKDDPSLRFTSRLVHSPDGRSGQEAGVARSCVKALTPWKSCLLWVTGWGIWPSSEDWPQYYAARGRLGEKRSLQEAPGQLFEAGEARLLQEFLTLVLENGWEAQVLPSDAAAAGRRIHCSHDGWTQLRSRQPGVDLAAV